MVASNLLPLTLSLVVGDLDPSLIGTPFQHQSIHLKDVDPFSRSCTTLHNLQVRCTFIRRFTNEYSRIRHCYEEDKIIPILKHVSRLNFDEVVLSALPLVTDTVGVPVEKDITTHSDTLGTPTRADNTT